MIKKVGVILFALIYFTNSKLVAQTNNSVYQKILAEFCENQLNSNLFKGECTGLKFEKKNKIIINLDSALWEPSSFVIGNYFNLSLDDIISGETDSTKWERLIDQIKVKNIPIDLKEFPGIEMTSLITPQLNGESDNNYLIRFSSPLIWDKYSFIEMWIKQSYYSSGIRFIYKIDASGSIDEVKKNIVCDDWG